MSDMDRSFWAWGYEDEVEPFDADAMLEHKEFLEGELGFPERPVREPIALAEVDLPDPAVSVPADLDGFVSTDREFRAKNTYGMSLPDQVRAGFRNEFDNAPDAVARPETEEEVADLLAWATEANVAVVPYGGGTGVVGGTEAAVGGGFAGAVSLDLGRMDRVLEVDGESRTALIQGGALAPGLNDQLRDHDLHLRHYPQSYKFASLGGMIATRSGGHYATRYTHIEEFVESATMVTPAGTFETQRIPASGAGPDPNRLIAGSEGMLGAITKAWMRVEPRPIYRSDASVYFETVPAAADAMREIVQAKLYPANCRLHDRTETSMYGLTDVDKHLVVLGFESTDYPTDDDLERAIEICERHGGDCPEGPIHYGDGFSAAETTDSDKDRWGRAFGRQPYTGNYGVALGVVSGTVETAVTWSAFEEFHEDMVRTLEEACERECGMGHVSVRFTHVYPDGPAPYYSFSAPGDPDRQIEQWRAIKRAGLDCVMGHGLTPTHHHAVGRDHREWYARQRPENYGESLKAMKDVLDPAGIMNPGVLLD